MAITEGQQGATAVEYAIMAALIAAVIVLVVAAIGTQTCAGFAEASERAAEAGIGSTGEC